MQNAKDTFYGVLRARLAAVNPERTAVVRGVARPAVLVEENELVSGEAAPVDCFRLRWTSAAVNSQGAMPLVTLTCEVLYETAGTALFSGMDRGRVMGAMDAELSAIVNAAPQSAQKVSYSGVPFGKSAAAMATNVWWGDVEFGAAAVKAERLTRVATIEVMAYQEAGEV